MIYTFTRNFNCNTIAIRFFAGLLSWNRCKNALKCRTKADKLHTHGPNIVWIKEHFGMYTHAKIKFICRKPGIYACLSMTQIQCECLCAFLDLLKDFMAFMLAIIEFERKIEWKGFYWTIWTIQYNIIRWMRHCYFPLGFTKSNEKVAFDANKKLSLKISLLSGIHTHIVLK